MSEILRHAPYGTFPIGKVIGHKEMGLALVEWLDVGLRPIGMKVYGPPVPARLSDGYPLARAFHETYERLAPQYGYETRADTKAFDPTTPNGKLMVAVCAEMLSLIRRTDAITVPSEKLEPNGEVPYTPFAYEEVHKFYERWPGGLDEIDSSLNQFRTALAAAARDAERNVLAERCKVWQEAISLVWITECFQTDEKRQEGRDACRQKIGDAMVVKRDAALAAKGAGNG